MAQLLPPSYIQAKNRLHNTDPMLMLMQWTVATYSQHFAVNASEDVIWNGSTWEPFPGGGLQKRHPLFCSSSVTALAEYRVLPSRENSSQLTQLV